MPSDEEHCADQPYCVKLLHDIDVSGRTNSTVIVVQTDFQTREKLQSQCVAK